MTTKQILVEQFSDSKHDERLQWAFPPSRPAIVDTLQGGLRLQTDGETDFWQRTHYGFQNHTGHFLHLPDVKGDFIMSTIVTTQPQQRFDQAGLAVLLSPSCWLKTSIEHGGPGRPSQLGVVVTNSGYSDWSTMEVPDTLKRIALRVRREGSDYIVEACVPEGMTEEAQSTAGSRVAGVRSGNGTSDSPPSDWTQLRICHLLEDVSPAGVGKDGDGNISFGEQLDTMKGLLPLSGVAAGLYACSPKAGEGFTAVFHHLHIISGRLTGHM